MKIVYVENPVELTIKLLVLIQEFSKVVGYRSIYKSQLHILYTSNEQLEIETKNLYHLQ